MKNLYIILITAFILSCQSNNPSSNSEPNFTVDIDSARNSHDSLQVHYYPLYDVNHKSDKVELKGAYGWVIENCNEGVKEYGKIIAQNVSQSHISYTGNLTFISDKGNDTIVIDLDCFEPDYTVGNWLD